MTTTTITLDQFIADNRISMTAERCDRNPNMSDSNDMDHWKVVLVHTKTETQITYRCRDIGYGIERGTIRGEWSGEPDWTGKRMFIRSTESVIQERALYLFPDEVVREKQVDSIAAKLTTYFSMGYGHKGAEPAAADVLDCLASDSSGIDRDFEEWCGDYGYDTDSRTAERTYKAGKHASERLERFLGADLYQTLLYGTERQ